MRAQEKAGQSPGLPIAARSGNQFEEFELEFDEEFELEFDDEFELELEDEFELLFEEELELELELLLDDELELLLDEEFELLFDDEFELEFEEEFDSPRRFWPALSFLALKAVVTKSVLPVFAVRSLAVPVWTAAAAGMMNDPAATAVAASKVVSFLI